MSNTNVLLHWSSYRYFPYEKYLARREVKSLLNPSHVVQIRNGLRVSGKFDEANLRRLVYFAGYELNGEIRHTLQSNLESSCTVTGSQRRQSTRYSVHGMHEYKGKFNPQVVRGILNILGVSSNSRIIDPFCGSGTTLVECSHVDMNATGYDINPLAIYIANTKLKSLSTPEPKLRKYFFKLGKTYGKRGQNARFLTTGNGYERIEYLKRWFNESALTTIERLRSVILNVTDEYSDIFLVLASNLIRDYSLQEPTDLRIRRRYTPFPKQSLWDAFNFKALRFLDNLASVQQVIGIKKNNSRAFLCDSRTINRLSCLKQDRSYNAAITSPPYATALPYIDTQRLSLVWLDLLSPNDIGNLESHLTGSREFISDQKQQWFNALAENSKHLPSSIYEYCLKLQRSVSKDDGFRRRSVPSLMYRYLSDMRDVFKSMLEVMRNSAPFALIVGHNLTTLGGKQFDIDTPALLKNIALECGWLLGESFTLQTYQRYGSHVANAVRAETLLIVRKP